MVVHAQVEAHEAGLLFIDGGHTIDFRRFAADVRDRTQTAMTQSHVFTVCRLALEAQALWAAVLREMRRVLGRDGRVVAAEVQVADAVDRDRRHAASPPQGHVDALPALAQAVRDQRPSRPGTKNHDCCGWHSGDPSK